MESFDYYNPVHVIFGVNSLSQIGDAACRYGGRAMLVSYNEHRFFDSVIDEIHRNLREHKVNCIDYFNITANPLLCQAREGVEICKKEKVDVLIALGGGSVMDCTKVIAAGVLYPEDISKMIMFSHEKIQSIPPERSLPSIMIPTLPATGSEMNPTAVITDEVSKRKSYVWHPSIYPKLAIMDPVLTKTLPPYQTCCGAFDIIAHVMEAYINGEPKLDLTLQEHLQEGVIRTVLESLPLVMEHPDDLQVRGTLMWAASIALNGWLTSGTFGFTPMHQMGHVLSAQYNATHGATLACMMHSWMRYFEERQDNIKYKQFAQRIFGTSIKEAADCLENLICSYGIETHISQFGATEADLKRLTDEVVSVSFGPDKRLNGNPKMMRDDILNIFRISL